MDYQLLVDFLIAIALGTLIGLEREYTQIQKGVRGYGGIRTFPLIALTGALSGFFAGYYSIWIMVIGFGGVAALILTSHYFFSARQGRIGLTTEIAGLVTFWIGVLSYLEQTLLAIILTMVMTLFLYERTELHQFVARMKKEELYSTIKFALIAFVVLPILPDTSFGPFDFFNPHRIWLLVVLVSGISFVGYVMMKWFGRVGVELVGFLGGFVSSTATTLSIIQERKSRDHAASIFGIVAANMAMMMKVLFFIFIISREVFALVVFPVGMMIMGGFIFSAILSHYSEGMKHSMRLRSPFTFMAAVKFAVVFTFILFIVKASLSYLSERSLYIVGFLSGLFDADATVLSMLQVPHVLSTVSTTIVIILIANTISKSAIAFLFGDKKCALKLSLVLLDVVLFGVLGLVFLQ